MSTLPASNRADDASTRSRAARSLAVILPYAVSIRDFVHSGTFAGLLSIPDLTIDIYTQNPDLPEFDNLRSACVTLREMGDQRQARIERALRQYYPILFADQFEFVRQNVERSRGRRLLARAVVAARRTLGTKRTLGIYSFLLKRLSARPQHCLMAGRPDLVIGTRSLVNSLDYPFIVEAARRAIPVLTIASSWDNFTTKGFFPFPVEATIVWNRKMAEELVEIFAVPRSGIVVAGYPRVGLIRDTGQFNQAEDYLKSIGLGQYKRFVLHTASYAELTRRAPGGVPLEYVMIRETAEALLPHLPDDTCILVRLHPYSHTDDEAVFAGLDRLHVFVPGRTDRYVERVMSAADEVHLASQLQLSACIVSMASTITVDALALNRPIINVAYDPESVSRDVAVIPRFYEFNHFRDLLARVHPPLARTKEDIVAFVTAAVAGKPVPTADLAAFEADYVPSASHEYPDVVRSTVEALLDRLAPRASAKGGI